MRNLINAIKRFFEKRKYKYKYVMVIEDSSIKESLNNTIMLYKKNGEFVWAKFKCPCGCSKDIVISLNPKMPPYWTVHLSVKGGKQYVSFEPSVYLTGFNCKSHFFIRNNEIVWV